VLGEVVIATGHAYGTFRAVMDGHNKAGDNVLPTGPEI